MRREITTKGVHLHVSWGWALFSAEVMKMLKLLLSHSEQVFNYLPVNFNTAQHLRPSSGLFQTSAVEVSENSRHALYNTVKLIGHMNAWEPWCLSCPLSWYRRQVVAANFSLWLSIFTLICFYLLSDLLSSFPYRRCIIRSAGQTVIILLTKSLKKDMVSVQVIDQVVWTKQPWKVREQS